MKVFPHDWLPNARIDVDFLKELCNYSFSLAFFDHVDEEAFLGDLCKMPHLLHVLTFDWFLGRDEEGNVQVPIRTQTFLDPPQGPPICDFVVI